MITLILRTIKNKHFIVPPCLLILHSRYTVAPGRILFMCRGKKKNRFIQEMPELEVRHEKCGIIPLLSLLKEMCSEHALVAPLTNELLNIL